MSRTEIMLRKALKKINELEKRIEKLEPKKPEPEFPKYDGDGVPFTDNIGDLQMARNMFGSRKLTKEDTYTKGKIQFSKSDEYFEYFKMFLLILIGLTYLWYIFT